jgi:hypothetical protein
MRASYSISCHHITSHSTLFFVRSVGAAWLSFAGAACDVHRRACVRASQRLQRVSLRNFHTWRWSRRWWRRESATTWKAHGVNESCLCLWKYLLRDGWREGVKYFCTSTCSAGCEDIRLASGTGFRIQDAPSKGLNTYLPRDMPPSEQREKAGCVVCMQHQYTVRVAV